MATTSQPRGSGFWFIIIAVAIIVLGGIWWLSASGEEEDGVGIDLDPSVAQPLDANPEPGIPDPTTTAPEPLPGSPAATGTAGVPSGTTGETTHPGDPTDRDNVPAPAAGTN